MTDQAPEDAPEDRPATAPTTKRKRKTRVVKRTAVNVDETAPAVEPVNEAAAADAAKPTDVAATAEPDEPTTEPADDDEPAPAETPSSVEEHAGAPDDTGSSADTAAVADAPGAETIEESSAEAPAEPDTVPAEAPEPEPNADEWRHETAGRAWPTLGDYPAAPAATAEDGTADSAWPEPNLPTEREPASWDKPAEPKRRELGRREAGLALAFLALGVTSGVIIGSNVTVPITPPAVVSHAATFERTIADAQQRTVTITVETPEGVTGRGAGTIIGSDGTVVTTNAVVRSPGGNVRVTTYNGRTLEGEFVGTDQTTGLTVLRVRGLSTTGFTTTSADVAAGTRVAVIGQNNNAATTDVASPRQAVNTITGSVGVGTWTGAVRLGTADDATATGGPIINDSGALVGIAVSGVTTGRESDPTGRQYGINAGVAVTVARNIATTGVALHGRIGAEVADEATGVLGAHIVSISDTGPAKTAGFRTGDVIVSYNGSRIGSAAQLVAAVRGTDPGTKADVEYLRNGKEHSVRLQITAAQ